MTAPVRLRLAMVLPLAFMALAATAAWWIWRSREFMSPVSGIACCVAVAVTAMLAIYAIWRARSSAPGFLAISGLCAFGLFAALPWLIPVVHATTEEITMLERYRYPIGLIAIAAITMIGVVFVHRALQAMQLEQTTTDNNGQSLLNLNS